MSLWDALTDIQKKVTEGVEQFQEVFDPNLVAPPPRARPVSSTAFSVDNDDTTSKRPGEDANFRKPDVSQSFRDSPGSSVPRPQANTGGPSRTLATASRDELVAVVQRQTAKIQQLQVRLDESHQENLVLRQERDTLKNMLRASDSELTEVKKSRAAARSAPKDDDSLVDSLKSQISHLQSLISERNSSMIVVQPVETSVSAENHVAKEHHLQQQQQQLESLIQENQKLQEDNAIAMHAAQQRISFLESENVNVLAQAAESRSFALSEAEAASNAIKAQLVESQLEAATLNSVVSELRTKVCALEASIASHVSKTATDSRVCIDSVPSQAADISSSTSESNLVTELPVQSGVSLSANGATEREHFNEPASNQPSQDDFLKVRALAESATAEAVASRAQLSVAESRICELVAQLDELQTKASTQVHEGESSAPAQQVLSLQRDSAEIADIRSEMDDLISAMDHLSAAVASVNFPNQPALPTHSLPCHLSKAAFTSFKQLADAVDAVVSQLVRHPLCHFIVKKCFSFLPCRQTLISIPGRLLKP
jgi:chromosome segregation ATPase